VLPRKFAIKTYFTFPPHLTCPSALPRETGNPKIASFYLNVACFLPKTHETLKYHLVTAEPPFTVKTIDWMHQTWPRILLSVTHMLYVNQICHGVSRCVKDGSSSSSSLSESQWAVLMGCLVILTNVDAMKHITDDNFFSFRKTAHWCTMCLQRSPTVAAFSTNTAFEWKCDFRVSPFCQVVQKHKLFEVACESIFWLPTSSVTFLPKISKSVHVCQSYSHRWDVL